MRKKKQTFHCHLYYPKIKGKKTTNIKLGVEQCSTELMRCLGFYDYTFEQALKKFKYFTKEEKEYLNGWCEAGYGNFKIKEFV